MYTFSSVRGHLVPKSLRCTQSALKLGVVSGLGFRVKVHRSWEVRGSNLSVYTVGLGLLSRVVSASGSEGLELFHYRVRWL